MALFQHLSRARSLRDQAAGPGSSCPVAPHPIQWHLPRGRRWQSWRRRRTANELAAAAGGGFIIRRGNTKAAQCYPGERRNTAREGSLKEAITPSVVMQSDQNERFRH
jgi:hypothetical protein